MSSKLTQGGKRNGAGRKPLEDKKIPIFLYIKESIVEKYGTGKEVKAYAEKAIIRNAAKLQ